MRGYRFYQEPHGRGNCLAVVVHTEVGNLCDALAAVSDRPNSPVALGPVATRYIARRCKRVPERRARAIHPELFRYLENSEP